MYDYNVLLAHGSGPSRTSRRPRFFLLLILATAVGFAFFGLDSSLFRAVTDQDSATTIDLPDLAQFDDPAPDAETVARRPLQRLPFEPATLSGGAALLGAKRGATPRTQWSKLEVGPGDNLSLIFGRYGYSKSDLHKILNAGPEARNLRRIKPGQMIMVNADADGHVLGLVQEIDYRRSLNVTETGDGYVASVIEIEPEIRYTSALAHIEQSLFQDGQAAGIADNTIMGLSEIFGWDIDFVLDVRKGDQFSLIYEEIYKDGKKVRDGKILAAEFVNRGKKLRAVYYEHADGHNGYYSDSGTAMRKAFLRAPVDFTRISSKFNLARRHPVLNTIRAHRGVDYAAPHGTPIRATASGRITFAGSKGGYGRTVVIKHGDAYSTLFAHMSRFARGIKNGARVSQGQTIGYVGKTGLATGPHLHYEFRVNGVHKNPLKVDLPKAMPLEKKYIADFRAKAAPLLAQLDNLDDSARSDKLVANVDSKHNRSKAHLKLSNTQ